MGAFSIWHLVVVLVVIVLCFGVGKLPNVMGDMAKGVKAFKKGMAEEPVASVEPAKDQPAIKNS